MGKNRNRWFSKIGSRDDALIVIKNTSIIFFGLAGIQVLLTIFLVGMRADKLTYSPISQDYPLNLLGTAIVIAVLAALLRFKNSRIAAVLLLTVSVFIFLTGLASPPGTSKGNLFFALVAIWAGARATLATFRLRGRFAEKRAANNSKPATAKPAADNSFDRNKWAALLKYDDDIAIAADQFGSFGQKWVDEFARSYLAINDKRYLSSIVQKILAEVAKEIRTPPTHTRPGKRKAAD